jgi:hypothetical protein
VFQESPALADVVSWSSTGMGSPSLTVPNDFFDSHSIVLIVGTTTRRAARRDAVGSLYLLGYRSWVWGSHDCRDCMSQDGCRWVRAARSEGLIDHERQVFGPSDPALTIFFSRLCCSRFAII